MKRNLPTPEGRQLGVQIARLYEPVIAELGDERCSTCAFRAGSLPNGCEATLMDAIKCGFENVEFYCHDKRRLDKCCHGWVAMRHGLGDTVVKMPWEFSYE